MSDENQYNVVVNDDCISCGLCVNLCDDVFEFGDDGKSHAIADSDGYEDEVEEAINGCPVGAISHNE